ncbi:origin recognition complex subunit 1-like [Pyrus ussuriensis x Pyrus communis]|uniref:Origin recognition complex subunit 1 n=1 Tax=Pyrus ussuriensis x Pyrus communis TaxID=2448454 RepID=A0A5N5FSN3_9ROSA|nr:origin recognition complex subunit 1-like [Pyrus ussuriensis x Pyrus communis]
MEVCGGNVGIAKTPKSAEKGKKLNAKEEGDLTEIKNAISPVTPGQSETKKRKREQKSTVVMRSRASKNVTFEENKSVKSVPKRRAYYKKVVYDGGEFEVGDNVFVRRREDASSDEVLVEVEECRVCFKSGKAVMIECDDCLGGFHLKCLKPPLKDVGEQFRNNKITDARKLGKVVQLPTPPEGKKLVRTLREKLLSSNLWAAHIERWQLLVSGTLVYNPRRDLIGMESILRHCFVMSPKEYAKASNEGDDVFLCEYEYDIHWYSFKRLSEIDDVLSVKRILSPKDWKVGKDSDFDSEEDMDYDEESIKSTLAKPFRAHELAAQTDLEIAKAALLLSSLPKSLPCRDKEMLEITAFIKDSISDDKCLGRCLYIHGVPGTGKTMSGLAVMKNLRSECRKYKNPLFCGAKWSKIGVIYEALSGHRVGWKKALHLLNERFSEGKKIGKEDDEPCILLIDELGLLLTRNQSVTIFSPFSIANTMDLPEKLLPRISSRMGIQRLCFGPYNYQQLQEIVSSRLKGINAFKQQAIEFASRKVAAISGDAHRALEICRRKTLVGMAEVEAAIQEMFQAPHIQASDEIFFSKLSKIFLTAMVYELYKTGMGETTFEKVNSGGLGLICINGEAFPGHDTLLKLGCKLSECRIILCESGAKHRLQKLQLNFPSDDVAFALKDNKELPWLAKYL